MDRTENVIRTLDRYSLDYEKKATRIESECPKCGRSDKFTFLRSNGHSICYHGSCQWRGWLEDFIVEKENGKVTRKAAREIAYGYVLNIKQGIQIKMNLNEEKSGEADAEPISFPDSLTFPLTDPRSKVGLDYVTNRGIPVEVAEAYSLHYCVATKRVVIPVIMNGEVFGWQGRATYPCTPAERMRNNEGFRRDMLIAFHDNLIGSDHAIIGEGPFDAMKFDLCGGNICTFGKVVTNAQIRAILESGVTKVYLALDDDAEEEMLKLRNRIPLPIYRIRVPQSCVNRCHAKNKKADFGECTFEEALEAFKAATLMDKMQITMKLL